MASITSVSSAANISVHYFICSQGSIHVSHSSLAVPLYHRGDEEAGLEARRAAYRVLQFAYAVLSLSDIKKALEDIGGNSVRDSHFGWAQCACQMHLDSQYYSAIYSVYLLVFALVPEHGQIKGCDLAFFTPCYYVCKSLV